MRYDFRNRAARVAIRGESGDGRRPRGTPIEIGGWESTKSAFADCAAPAVVQARTMGRAAKVRAAHHHRAVILRPGHAKAAAAQVFAGPKDLAAAATWPGRGSGHGAEATRRPAEAPATPIEIGGWNGTKSAFADCAAPAVAQARTAVPAANIHASPHAVVILRPGHAEAAAAQVFAGPKDLAAAATWPGRGSVRNVEATSGEEPHSTPIEIGGWKSTKSAFADCAAPAVARARTAVPAANIHASPHAVVILRPGHAKAAATQAFAGPKDLAAAATWPGRGSVDGAEARR